MGHYTKPVYSLNGRTSAHHNLMIDDGIGDDEDADEEVSPVRGECEIVLDPKLISSLNFRGFDLMIDFIDINAIIDSACQSISQVVF